MKAYSILPLSPLVFRGGGDLIPGRSNKSLDFPLPGTLAGALRHRYLQRNPARNNDYSGVWKNA